jgi:protein O-mannosyl-transferase
VIRLRHAARPWLIVAALAFVAAAPSLVNGFVYDDAHIILRNPIVHRLADWPAIWVSAYWPAGLAYRPLAIQLFALEWAAGGGHPFVFHLVNVGLAVGVAILMWRLARRVLPETPAAIAAALFAVHPVHVESIANTVGQAELLVGFFGLLTVERYIVWRDAGPLTAGHRSILALLTALAIHAKETGYVIPALLVAAEILLVRPRHAGAWRWRQAVPALSIQVCVAVASVLLRVTVIGATTGAGPSVSLMDLPAPDRIVGMLAVVPEWARLLLWPAHLQAEYGPPAVAVTGTFGAAHLAGLVLLIAALGLIAVTWRRVPLVAFGLLWAAIAIAPVSNILAPTGVILAERTLFLPSVGIALVLGAVAQAVLSRPRGRLVVAGATAVLVALGLVRSATRSTVWRDQDRFFAHLSLDAPRTYRAHKVAAEYLAGSGKPREAEVEWRRALELYEGDGTIFEELGQLYRAGGECHRAIPVLERGLVLHPGRTVVRARFIECHLKLGDTTKALMVAREGVALGHTEFDQTVRRLTRRMPVAEDSIQP